MHCRHRFPMLFIKLSDTGIGKRRPDTEYSLNNPSSVRSCIIIHQNEVVTNSSSIWADIGSRISSRYLRPVTVPPWNTCKSVWPPSEMPKPDSTTSITVSFNSVGLMVSSALFPPDQ
ncbi:hypothetical protein TNCV_4155941 [Trichonephila clavipes]|nr:hypothetical protein TNCV_4155941 [Trichonephila clavipes]